MVGELDELQQVAKHSPDIADERMVAVLQS
jgi:hypothetical protein